MPTWGQLLQELNQLTRNQVLPTGQVSPHDKLRRKYLAQLSQHTGRNTIVYATSWLENVPNGPSESLQIRLGDVQAFMEACSDLEGRELDLILTTPGGSPEAAESIIAYLRTRFDSIRVIVPVAAMSAGTMLALSSDQIIMGSHSQLGPIDPQITVNTPEGPRSAPAQAILDQFELAKKECQDPANIGGWLPMLRALLPGLLASCNNARTFSREFTERELREHMFASATDPAESARRVADFFGDFKHFNSHGRRIARGEARSVGVHILDLEDDPVLQDLALSVHHAVRLTHSVGMVKIVENQNGRAYIESQQQMQLFAGGAPPGAPILFPPTTAPPVPRAQPQSRGPAPGVRQPGRRPRKGK